MIQSPSNKKRVLALPIVLVIVILFCLIKTTTSNVISTTNPTFSSTLVTTVVTSSSLTSTLSSLIPSYYSGVLSSSSGIYTRPETTPGSTFYYQSILVRIYTSGKYTFSSISSLDTYGYLYINTFNPSLPSQNLIASDDDSGGSGQFLINSTLSSFQTYILVVTTFYPNKIGTFSITALGPALVSLSEYIITTVWSTTTLSPVIPSYYSGVLSSSSGIYTRPEASPGSNFYYQLIEVRIYTSGKYTFTSSCSLDTYGYFYSNTFDPSLPSQNLMASDDDSGGSGQFRINVTLTYGNRYILLFTTFYPNQISSFSITALGPSSVSLTSIMPTTTMFYGSLTSNSERFSRPTSVSNGYYYQSIEVTAHTSGTYTFISISSMDTYGCFYRNNFDPSNPSENLIAIDDDSGGSGQFRIIVSLQAESTYILVVTTSFAYTTGSFSVKASGPALVNLLAIRSDIGPSAILITIIVVISVIFFVTIFGICLRRRNQQITINQLNNYSSHNPNVQSSIYSVPRSNPNEIARIHGAYVEKAPPTYNSILSTLPSQ